VAQCAWEGVNQKGCHESVARKGELCVLHDRTESKDRVSFRGRVLEKILAGDFDFRGTYFPEVPPMQWEFRNADFSEAIFETEANFAKAVFHGETRFFRSRFKAEAHFGGSTFHGEAFFIRATFEGDTDFDTFRGDAHFSHAEFHGLAVFLETTFGGYAGFDEATFHSKSLFQGATFGEHANFVECKFQVEASFVSAKFESKADFQKTVFSGEANFALATFGSLHQGGHTEFNETRFESAAIFDRARFLEGCVFRNARFAAEAAFRSNVFAGAGIMPPGSGFSEKCVVSFFGTHFKGKAYVENVECDGALDFARVEFGSSFFFLGPLVACRGTSAGDAPPPPAKLREIRLAYVMFEEPSNVHFEFLDLRKTIFVGSNIRGVRFRGVTWPAKLWGKELDLQSARAKKESAYVDSLHQSWRWFLGFLAHKTVGDEFAIPMHKEEARLLCRDLKASLEDQRDYPEAGEFYYAEMELRRKSVPAIFRPLFDLYWLVCGYGEKPLRSILVFLCMWFLFGTAYKFTWFTLSGEVSWRNVSHSIGPVSFRPYWVEALNYSLRSLTLQQKGGYLEPYTPWAHHLTVIANLLGPLQLGFIFLAMRRKFRR
jgi:uncharacterized protein YjbI with pentapeptide repeats